MAVKVQKTATKAKNKDAAAQQKLQDMALAAGVSQAQIDAAADWPAVAALIVEKERPASKQDLLLALRSLYRLRSPLAMDLKGNEVVADAALKEFLQSSEVYKHLHDESEKASQDYFEETRKNEAEIGKACRTLTNRIYTRGATEANVKAVEELCEKYADWS